MDIATANQTAVQRMMSARPMLKTVAPAREVVPGMHDRLLLHRSSGSARRDRYVER